MAKEDMVINPITGEIDLDLHRIVKGFSKGGQSLKDSLELDTPRRTPSHPSSSHVVKTKVDGKDKMIRFGEQGAKTNQNPKQRKAFKDRHAKNIAKGKSSAAYWADKVKWKAAEGGAIETGGPVDLARNVIGQGLLLGWGDEAEAWVRSKLGEGTYEEAVAEIRAGNEAYSEDSPYASLAGEIVGGLIPTAAALVATPFTGGASTAAASGNLARLASIGARRLGPLGTAGVVGATEGAIAGAGMAEEGERLEGAGTGAVIGGTLGTGLQKGSELAINAINKKALNKAASQVPDDSAYDALRQKYLDQGMIMQAVREPGDQILDTAPVDDALTRLRINFGPSISEESSEALKNWTNTKLRKFILNEMGSKNDSVRLAADEGFTLGPGDYEKLADDAISQNTQTAGTYLNRYNMFMDDDFISLGDGTPMRESAMGQKVVKLVEENPWLSKVPPETVIRDIDEFALTDNLNFRHMIDEITNAMDPNTSLPRQLQISPKDLKKISMRQMVEKISKINDWRMKEADKIGKKELLDNIANTNTIIDLPDFDLSFVDKKGGGWVEMPDAASDSGGRVCTTIGKAGGWCTQGAEMAKSYGSGDNKLIALLDGEGRPHVQLNLKTNYKSIPNDGSLVLGEVKPIGNGFFSDKTQNYMSKDPEYRTKLGSALKTFLNENQNDISTSYISGGTQDILDFGIFDMKNMDHVQAKLEDIFSEEFDKGMASVVDENFQSMLAGSQADGIEIPRFLTRSEFVELMDPYTIVSDSGYAKGGAVYNPNLIKKNAVQLLMEANNG